MSKLFWMLQVLIAAAVCSLPAQAGAQTPQDVVASATDQVLQVLRADTGEKDPRTAFGAIERLIVPHVDLQKISQRLLGEQWLAATAAQKQRFTDEFRKLLVKTYATVFRQYASEKIAYLPDEAGKTADIVTVKSRVMKASGTAVPIDYRLQQQNGEWKVFDVAVDGVSLVASYRASIQDGVASMGMDGLIDALSARNQS